MKIGINYFKNTRYRYLASLICLFIIGCNSDTESNGGEQIIEHWYFGHSEQYISVGKDGLIKFFKCSINDGFIVDERVTGQLDENELVLFLEGGYSQIYSVNYEDHQLTIDDFTFTYELVSEIPQVCNSDAIEITYYSPTEAYEGTQTEFVVNFDYRLTHDNGVVEVGFTSGEGDEFTIVQGALYEISNSGTGSGSITLQHSPESLGDSVPHYMHVNLSPTDQGQEYSPYATDSVLVNVLLN